MVLPHPWGYDMENPKKNKKIMSLGTLLLFVTAGFMGFFTFYGLVDEGDVDAATLYVGPGQAHPSISSAIAFPVKLIPSVKVIV